MGKIRVVQGDKTYSSVIREFFIENGATNPLDASCDANVYLYFINAYNEIDYIQIEDFNKHKYEIIPLHEVLDFVYAKHNEVVTSEVTPIVCSDTNEYIDYFDDILKEMSDVHQRKNADYGNNFHKRYEKYGFLTALLRLTDKMERLENIYEKGEIQVKDESVEDTLLDLANYAVMTIVELRNNKKETD